jgi:hypothetical protein
MNTPNEPEVPSRAHSVAMHHPHDPGHNLPLATTLPTGVLAVGVVGYLGIVGAFWLAFGADPEAAGVLVVASLFAAMYFGLPLVMNRTASKHHADHAEQSMADFLTGDFDTLNGRVSGWSALIQFAFLPVALAFGALAFGVILTVLR